MRLIDWMNGCCGYLSSWHMTKVLPVTMSYTCRSSLSIRECVYMHTHTHTHNISISQPLIKWCINIFCNLSDIHPLLPCHAELRLTWISTNFFFFLSILRLVTEHKSEFGKLEQRPRWKPNNTSYSVVPFYSIQCCYWVIVMRIIISNLAAIQILNHGKMMSKIMNSPKKLDEKLISTKFIL